jgi:hypothetical protein
MSYGYDSASELTGINYTLGSNTLGNLTYAYDLAGRRVNVGGSYAATGLPQPIASTAYDAANELTQWGTATPTYDSNGNVLSDGTNSYAWDARNHLVSMNSGGASFQYDPFGRRAWPRHCFSRRTTTSTMVPIPFRNSPGQHRQRTC